MATPLDELSLLKDIDTPFYLEEESEPQDLNQPRYCALIDGAYLVKQLASNDRIVTDLRAQPPIPYFVPAQPEEEDRERVPAEIWDALIRSRELRY